MASNRPPTKISGTFTDKEWTDLRKRLLREIQQLGRNDSWDEALSHFDTRVRVRFLEPIRKILNTGRKEGEGFAAMAIMCLLVEFLEAFYQGRLFSMKKEEDLLPFEYNSSRSLFRDFLTCRPPFKDYFNSSIANKFYDGVRCGLLHEARTKENWVIREGNVERLYENKDGLKIIKRSAFLSALSEWLNQYIDAVRKDVVLRQHFLRKMDDLCDISHFAYFAYGRNLSIDQMKNRCRDNFVEKLGMGILKNYDIVFNKKSNDGTAKANIEESDGTCIYGMIYEVDHDGFKFLEEVEKGYNVLKLNVHDTKSKQEYKVSVFVSENIDKSLSPSRDYADEIIEALKKERFPAEYINYVRSKIV